MSAPRIGGRRGHRCVEYSAMLPAVAQLTSVNGVAAILDVLWRHVQGSFIATGATAKACLVFEVRQAPLSTRTNGDCDRCLRDSELEVHAEFCTVCGELLRTQCVMRQRSMHTICSDAFVGCSCPSLGTY